jgi:3-oxoacyl-[acyl-carrier protein] reductase
MAMSKVLQFDCVADNVTVNNLLPGPFDTDRLAALAQRYVERTGSPWTKPMPASARAARPGASASRTNSAMPAPSCARQAGYISGQCLTLDGGAYRGLF